MTVREFDGIDDQIRHATGGLSGMTYGTVACIFKTDTIAAGPATIMAFYDSSGFFRWGPLSRDTATIYMYSSGSSVGPTISAAVWYLAVMRKGTGTVTPRFSLYNFNTSGWTHANGSVARPDGDAPGVSGTIRTDIDGGELWDGRFAMRAAWANEVHWSADTTGDTAIEAAGLEDSLQKWIDETPTALWAFNQESVATPVDDLSVTGTADQSTITGTTVVTGDDPPGFTFDLGPPPTVVPRVIIVSG